MSIAGKATPNMIWMPINGQPGFHVSDMGVFVSPSGKLLKQRFADGRLRVRIRGRWFTVWKVVLEAFAGGPRAGYRPRHLNDDLFDNRYENLVYAGAPRTEARPPRIDHCRFDHELVGDNVEIWGMKNRICVKCRDG